MAEVPTLDLVLDYLSSSVTIDVSGEIYSEPPVELDVSAVAVFEVDLSVMKDMFKYQTDSNDAIDASASDIKYYVDKTKWPDLNPANAMMDHTSSEGEIATNGSDGNPLAANKMLVAHDFTRYLALKLFNTHFGVDLFSNELELLNGLRHVCGNVASGQTQFDINAKIAAVSNDNEDLDEDANNLRYTTNAMDGSNNLCRTLMLQLLDGKPARFATIDAVGTPQSLPFIAGDTISFKLIVNAAEGQELITGVDPIGARSYRIKFVIVDDDADPGNVAVNTAVAEDEPAPAA
jgi:hypothetical protein